MLINDYPEKIAKDNADYILISEPSGVYKKLLMSQVGSGGSNDITFIQLTHTVASGTNGGTATFSNWTDRPINTIDIDESGQVTLLNDTFVLPSGVYYVDAKSTFYGLADTKLRLFNKTSNTSLVQGINGWVNPAGTVALPLILNGQFSVTNNQSLSLQYWAKNLSNSSQYNYGGSVSDGSPEKYASINFWKVN